VVPAFMHFFGVFMQVHFEAKRYGLRGLTPQEMPRLRESLQQRWPTLIPLVLLISILVSGRTPYLAAFTGITSCIIVGLVTSVRGNKPGNWIRFACTPPAARTDGVRRLGRRRRQRRVGLARVRRTLSWAVPRTGVEFARARVGNAVLLEAFETGAKYALAVGAAAATVGIVIGVVTLTGVGFKISFIITGWAQAMAGFAAAWLPAFMVDIKALTLLCALFMTGVVCILMGCGIPTTANYIIMVTVAAPTLVQLGVQPSVAHFFAFYYGVLADITPPVALAAYAAARHGGQ